MSPFGFILMIKGPYPIYGKKASFWPAVSEDSDHRIRDIWLHVLEQNILPGESHGEKLLNLIMDRKLKKTEKDPRTRPIPNVYLIEFLELTKVSSREPNI